MNMLFITTAKLLLYIICRKLIFLGFFFFWLDWVLKKTFFFQLSGPKRPDPRSTGWWPHWAPERNLGDTFQGAWWHQGERPKSYAHGWLSHVSRNIRQKRCRRTFVHYSVFYFIFLILGVREESCWPDSKDPQQGKAVGRLVCVCMFVCCIQLGLSVCAGVHPHVRVHRLCGPEDCGSDASHPAGKRHRKQCCRGPIVEVTANQISPSQWTLSCSLIYW